MDCNYIFKSLVCIASAKNSFVFVLTLMVGWNCRRLSDVLDLLTSRQPSCPQLYIYSSADRVIPAVSVESFVEEQRRIGRDVRACNFVSTPHVDHFRNDPELYTSQLTQFLEDSVLSSCKQPSWMIPNHNTLILSALFSPHFNQILGKASVFQL